MKLSVIIPVFNGATWIGRAIDSVLEQQFEDWELIVVDDGSTDGTADVIDRMAATDKRISVVHQANAGPGVARNAGMAVSRGKFLVFLDADDAFVSPDALATAVARAEATQCECLVCGAVGIHVDTGLRHPLAWCLRTDLLPGQDVFSGKDAGLALFFLAGAVPWAKLYRRDFILRHGLTFPPLRRSEDFPFVQLSLALADRIAASTQPLIMHRIGVPGSLESTKDETPRVFIEAENIFAAELRNRELECVFGPAAKARAMLRLAYNLNAIRSLDGLRMVFAYAREERKNLCAPDVAAPFRDYALAKRDVDGILAYGSAEAWVYARMEAAERSLRSKEMALRKAKRDNEMLAAAKEAQAASLLRSRREVAQLKRTVVSLEEKSSALERSEAYRVGMFVTWPARKAWGGVKCLRENGLKYTARHAVGKVLRLFGSKCKW